MKARHFFITGLCAAALYTLFSKENVSFRRESPHVILLFMKPYEEFRMQEDPSSYDEPTRTELFRDPTFFARKILQNNFNPSTDPRGINVLFAGFFKPININNRMAEFPRLIQEDAVTLVITRKIRPVILRGNTVEYFVRDAEHDIAYYTLRRLYDDKQKILYWDVRQEKVPVDKKIPASAIIIFAEPQHIIVPLQQTIATPGPNLILPPIYANKGLEKDYNAISFLKISPYFDPVRHATKIAPPQRYAQKIANYSA